MELVQKLSLMKWLTLHEQSHKRANFHFHSSRAEPHQKFRKRFSNFLLMSHHKKKLFNVTQSFVFEVEFFFFAHKSQKIAFF
jgi:hypothetical protein